MKKCVLVICLGLCATGWADEPRTCEDIAYVVSLGAEMYFNGVTQDKLNDEIDDMDISPDMYDAAKRLITRGWDWTSVRYKGQTSTDDRTVGRLTRKVEREAYAACNKARGPGLFGTGLPPSFDCCRPTPSGLFCDITRQTYQVLENRRSVGRGYSEWYRVGPGQYEQPRYGLSDKTFLDRIVPAPPEVDMLREFMSWVVRTTMKPGEWVCDYPDR